jgi:hypothetical protein
LNATAYQVGQHLGSAGSAITGTMEGAAAIGGEALTLGGATVPAAFVGAHSLTTIGASVARIMTNPIRQASASNSSTTTASKAPHGNSKSSPKVQHGYSIRRISDNSIVKYGISGKPLLKDGTSARANKQVQAANGKLAFPAYYAQIERKNMVGRQKGLNWEQGKVNGYGASPKNPFPGEGPGGNLLPKARKVR